MPSLNGRCQTLPTALPDSRKPHIARHENSTLLAALLLVLMSVSGCAREFLPVPITQAPVAGPEATSTPAVPGPVVKSPGLVAIRMISEDDGWGVSDTAVLRTADGGLSWHDVTPGNAGALGFAVSSHFLDSRHAWILLPDAKTLQAGTLDRTIDGGETWSTFPVPFGHGVFQFLDATHGWMMASLGSGLGSEAVAVFQTTDAGSTWSQTYINDPTQHGASKSLPLGGLKDGITASDMATAWIGGVTYSPGKIYLYQTRDAGRTWSQSPVEAPEGYGAAELETTGPILINPTTAFLPLHLSSQKGVMLTVYISRDGGASWLLTPTLIPLGGPPDFVSAQAGFVWNGNNFYATTDSAQSWSATLPDTAFGASFGGMDFVSPLIGYVVTDAAGARGLYRTLDGGATWNLIAR